MRKLKSKQFVEKNNKKPIKKSIIIDCVMNSSVRSPSPDRRHRNAILATQSPEKGVMSYLSSSIQYFPIDDRQGNLHAHSSSFSLHSCPFSDTLEAEQPVLKLNQNQPESSSKKNYYPINYEYTHEEEIKHLRKQLKKYKSYVKEYQYLAQKNKKLEESMCMVLQELQQKNSPKNYQLHTTIESQEDSSSESQAPSYSVMLQDLRQENQTLLSERDFYQNRWQQEIRNKNKIKMQFQSLANHISFTFQQKVMKLVFKTQSKITKISLQQQQIEALRQLEREKINALEQELELARSEKEYKWHKQGQNKQFKEILHLNFSKEKQGNSDLGFTSPIRQEEDENLDSVSSRGQGQKSDDSKINLKHVTSQGDIQKSSSSVQIVDMNRSGRDYIRIDDHFLQDEFSSHKRTRSNFIYDQAKFDDGIYYKSQLQLGNDDGGSSVVPHSNTLNLSFNRTEELSQIMHQNNFLKQELQQLKKQHRLQLAVNQQMKISFDQLVEQLQILYKERRSWKGEDYDKNTCQAKKAFDEICNEIYELNQKVQDKYKFLGSCLKGNQQQRSLNSELEMRVKDLQHEKNKMQNQIIELNNEIFKLKKQLKELVQARDNAEYNPLSSQVRREMPIDLRFEQTQKRIKNVFEIIQNCQRDQSQ